MKKDSAETAAVAGLMQHLALSHPDVSFKFIKDGQESLHTPGDGKLESAVYAALGREFAKTLVPVQGRGGDIEVRGFVTAPVNGRGSRSMQVFFVNGRFIKSQLLTAALEEGYRNQIMKGKFPGCVLSVTLPVTAVDVNVHPAKTQVKFAREHDVFDAVYHTVLDALGKTSAPAAAPAQEARLPAASRQDFFQTMDAKTFRQGGAKPAPQPAAPARPAWNTELRAPARVADSGQTSFYQTKRSESAAQGALGRAPASVTSPPDTQQSSPPAPSCNKGALGSPPVSVTAPRAERTAPSAPWTSAPVSVPAEKTTSPESAPRPFVPAIPPERLKLTDNEKRILDEIARQTEEETGMDRAAAVAQMRFDYIGEVCSETVIKPRESKERTRSRQIDRFLTGKYTGIPAFIGIMGLVFWLTFNVVGAFLQGILETGIEGLTAMADTAMTAAGVNSVVQSLVIDGIFGGVGGVLSFLPIIVTLFFFLSLLEDSGYMARVAFIMDKLLRKLGLSGRSIVPMLVGFGCTVPGVMASRTLPSERDRKMTILLTPFMSCTAKLPIYAFFTEAFFPEHQALVMIGLYVLGIFMGILMALIFKKTSFKGEAVPFVMELPNYRMPGAANVGHLLWDKAKDFLQRAFTVIFLATIAIWFLQNFDTGFNMVADSQDSILALLAGVLAPVFLPMGFGDWRIVTALISGFMAKESVVSSLTVLFGSMEALQGTLTVPGAVSLLVFCLLYTPCVAAIASVKRELGGKWAVVVVVGQCAIAWLAAGVVRLIGLLFGIV